jgi:glycosyltransferase involved in cell wall biosynthesis
MNARFEVTIGIPVFKSVKYIEASLLSALNQTFKDIEFLIVDDCGNDGSMDIVLNIQNSHPRGGEIHILINDANYGVSYSRNRIIDEAKGRFLYFMDSDDTIEPDTIQLLYDAICINNAQIAYGSYEIIDDNGDAPNELYQKDSLVLNGKDKLALYAFKNNNKFHVSVCNNLVDLAFLRITKIKFIDASYWEDMAYTTELVTKVDCAVLLSNITYHYIRHAESLSHYQDRDVFEKSELLNNISVLSHMKGNCLEHRGKIYLPYLCYNLEMISFYMVCTILRYSHNIVPKFSMKEIKSIMKYPLPCSFIFSFKEKKKSNFMFALLSFMPIGLFLPSIWLLGKLKRAF